MHSLTPKQIEWARQHDWFGGVVPGGVVVRERVRAADGTIGTQISVHADIKSLRNAAGY